VPAIVWVRKTPRGALQRHRRARRGFTLIDVLVSLAVIAVLIGLMLPALTAIRETSRKVVCSSNIRQIGIATAIYADDYKGSLPFSRFYAKSIAYEQGSFSSDSLMQARVAPPTPMSPQPNPWDGLGILFGREYCPAGEVFYCPSHRSIHRYERYADGWNGAPVDVFTNFQYRGGTSDNVTNLNKMRSRICLVADGMARGLDYNHGVGGNVVISDLSVAWFDDSNHALNLPSNYNDVDARDKLQNAWGLIDATVNK
jgi:prepilin-type N-terminal cleavage/methylation domain-containing protein